MKTGLVRLFAMADNREIKSQVAYLPQMDQCQIWLASRLNTSELRSQLQDLIARVGFVEQTSSTAKPLATQIRSKESFELQRVDRLKRISNAVVEIGKWLPKFAQNFHSLRLALQSAPKSWQPNLNDVQMQLDELFQPGFMMHVPWDWLKEYPRYLQAMTARLERLKTIGATQDAKLQSQAQVYWDDYQTKVKTSSQTVWTSKPTLLSWPTGSLLQYRWMIEEYRVSLFAQNLGTRVSVSPKRLDKIKADCSE